MEFAFTEDQLAITEAARELLTDTCTPTDLRRMLASDCARDDARWASMRDMGLFGVLAPEEVGGLGLKLVDLIGIAEAAGYVALPEPLIEQAGIAVPLLVGKSCDDVLAAALNGKSVAIGYPGRAFVADADTADHLLLSHGDEIHLIERRAATLRRHTSIDPFRRLFSVEWSPSSNSKLTDGWQEALDRGTALTAAQLIGLAQRCIDLAVTYAKERVQFGKPIGSYQAVKHLIASAQVKVEFARPVVHAAAAEFGAGSAVGRARASHAKLAAGEAADLAARTAVQVHGAMGMTWEVDVHFFLKRIAALRFDWGLPGDLRSRVLERILNMPVGPGQSFASDIGA